MRAAVVEAFGAFDTIKVKEIPTPAPLPGEVLIRVSVAGVNFADGAMVSGRAPRKQPPFVPGVEAAGVVEAVGTGVTDLRAGDRVVYWDPMPCAFAEWVTVPAWRAVSIAAGVPDDVAVALMVQGATAHYLVTNSYYLRDAPEDRSRMADLFKWYATQALKPRIGGEWPLDGVGEALTKITAGKTTGKLLIRV